jgi:hypothetical protein
LRRANCVSRTISSNGRAFHALSLVCGFLFVCTYCPEARADVGVILNDSLDTSVARITGSGHSAVYLSRVCAETPIKLRLCRRGEMGSVISNYTSLGEDQPFEWNVVPLSVYLYGVDDPRFRPLFASARIKQALEEKYRERYLAKYCTSITCRTSNKAEWREMVGATLSRSLYVFVVKTTVQQDLAFIREFNSFPNVNHFNGISRNCATFTRRVINSFFPHSAHADYLNDFGMTSPKAIARSFTHYALKHPEMNFRVLHFAQLPGTIKRSSPPRSGTEQLYRSKKLVVPMAIFAEYELPVVAGTYLLTGRFNPERELEKHPASIQLAATRRNSRSAEFKHDTARSNDPDAEIERRMDVVGSAKEWKHYRKELDAITDEAVLEGIIPYREYPQRFLEDLGKSDNPVVDRDGALWLKVPEEGRTRKLGASASNILSPDSDSRLAYILLLARTDRILNSPMRSRETVVAFMGDWKRLQEARARALAYFASIGLLAQDREAAGQNAEP